jgi:hypothetical protein
LKSPSCTIDYPVRAGVNKNLVDKLDLVVTKFLYGARSIFALMEKIIFDGPISFTISVYFGGF